MITFFGIIKGLLIRDTTDTTKEFQVELDSAATTNTKTILIAAQTANRTLTLPDASGTLMTGSTADVLTGKTIDGDDNTIQDLALTSLKTILADANNFLVRDGSGIVVSNTKAVPTGNIVGTSDTQVLTNKDIDGGTASNTSRITLPKETTVNLAALTRKEGTIVYDTTLSAPFFDDGITLNPLTTAGAANPALSNLAGVAINTSLLPGVDDSINLGSASFRWQNAHLSSSLFIYGTGGNISALITDTVTTTPSGDTVNAAYTAANDQTFAVMSQNVTGTSASKNMYFESGNNSNAGSGGTGAVFISSGSVTSGTNNSSTGDLDLRTGSSVGNGVTGNINIATGLSTGGFGNINLTATLVRRSDPDANQFIEERYYDSISLASAQTDTVITNLTFAHADFQGFQMFYKVKESVSNDTRVANFIVSTDGTDVGYTDTGSETADTGITFDAIVSGANVQIRYSSGTNGGILRADVKRIRA